VTTQSDTDTSMLKFFFFQAEDGIRDFHVTGVQTCALPISCSSAINGLMACSPASPAAAAHAGTCRLTPPGTGFLHGTGSGSLLKIGRASCRERVEMSVVERSVDIKSRNEHIAVSRDQ